MKLSEIFEKRIGKCLDLVNYQDVVIPFVDHEKMDWDVQVHGNKKIKAYPIFSGG